MHRSSKLAVVLVGSLLATVFLLVGGGTATTARADTVPAWTSLGGSYARQGVGAVTVGTEEDIFAVDASGKVWRNTRDLSSGTWSGFTATATDGVLTSGVTAASTSDGRIFLFGRGVGPAYGIYYTYSDTSRQTWHTWRPLGGSSNFTPAAVMFTHFHQLCVFVTGTGSFAGKVFEDVHTYNVGDDPVSWTQASWTGWSVPTNLSTYLIGGAPSATIRPLSNQVSVVGFAPAPDYSLREARYTPSTGWAWSSMGGATHYDPAVISGPTDSLYSFVTGTLSGNPLYKNTTDNAGSWTGWGTPISSGSTTIGPITATQAGDNFDLYTVDTAGNVQTTTYAGPVLWGMNDPLDGTNGYPQDGGYKSNESLLGRNLALARVYTRLDDPANQPGHTPGRAKADMSALANSGHSIVVSVDAQKTDGTYVKYTDITDTNSPNHAAINTNLDAIFAFLKTLPTTTYFIFQHEPDGSDANMSCSVLPVGLDTHDDVCGPQFISAWNYVYNRAISDGVTNMQFVWDPESFAFTSNSVEGGTKANYYWCGAMTCTTRTVNGVNWIGIDAYSTQTKTNCSQGTWYATFDDMMNGPITWTQQTNNGGSNSLPVMLPEWGVDEGLNASDKANFFDGLVGWLHNAKYKSVQALTYFNLAGGSGGCDYPITSSSAAQTAFQAASMDPWDAAMPS